MSRPRHRIPSRKPNQQLPRWLRPKLSAATQRDLSMAQHQNVDAIASGTASVTLMHEWAEGLLMFSRIAEKLGRGEAEMNQQLLLSQRVVECYAATQRIEFADAAELELARDGLVVQELLAQDCDAETGMAAAHWSAQVTESLSKTGSPRKS